jgi:Flp pilus assembly protein TadG
MGHRHLRRFGGARDGSMALEFALMAPVLLLLAVAVIDFGGAVNRQMQLVGAVRAGVQLAVARPPSAGTLSEIRSVVQLAAGERSEGTQELVVDLFCEQADGAPIACGSGADQALATFVSIRVTEAWSPTLTYPLLRQAVPLAAGQTVRVR